MTDIIKDVEDIAGAGARLRTMLIVGAGMAALLGVLAVGFAHHFEERGRQLERAGWLVKESAERAADLALTQRHDADMRALKAHHEQIERETSEHHDQELAQLRRDRDADRRRADAAGGLRIPAPACPAGGLISGAEAAGPGRRNDPGAATIRLPQQVENDLWAIADDADEVSARLRACQGWIAANGFYGPNNADGGKLLDRIDAIENQNNGSVSP